MLAVNGSNQHQFCLENGRKTPVAHADSQMVSVLMKRDVLWTEYHHLSRNRFTVKLGWSSVCFIQRMTTFRRQPVDSAGGRTWLGLGKP